MSRSGHHRIRSFARWLATPILLASTAFVGYAIWSGEVSMLRISAVAAAASGIVAVALFDLELIRTRRDHGAERAMQAKAYIEMYNRRIREHLRAGGVPMPRLPEEPVLQASGSPEEPFAAEEAVSAEGARPALKAAPALVAIGTPRPVSAPAGAETQETNGEPDLWEEQDEAPTVVDLIAYEVRARLVQDERRELAEVSAEKPRAASG